MHQCLRGNTNIYHTLSSEAAELIMHTLHVWWVHLATVDLVRDSSRLVAISTRCP
jgi:hypothetical protein